MKIIKDGIITKKSPENKLENYWWLNYDFNCKNCNCRFKLERSDYPHYIQMYTDYIRLNCPYCDSKINITKPTFKNKWPDVTQNTPLFEEIFGETGLFSKIFGEPPFKK